jgi:hypothetical protein
MPVSEEELQKEQEEYENALESAIFDDSKTDDEINKELDEKLGNKTDEPGEGTRDQSTDDPNKDDPTKEDPVVEDDPVSDPSDPTQSQGAGDNLDTTGGESDCKECAALKVQLEEAKTKASKAEQKMSSWEGRIKAANKRVKELEAQLETADVKSASNDSDQEKIDKFRQDFPEFGEVLDVMDKRYKANTPDKETYDPDAPLDPVAQTDNTVVKSNEPTEHFKAIVKVHPDIDELTSSKVIVTWIRKQPDYIRPHLEKVYTKGSSDEVIKMVTEFKSQTGWKSQTETAVDPKQKKLQAMRQTDGSESPGPKNVDGPDKNDFDGAAKEAFAEER